MLDSTSFISTLLNYLCCGQASGMRFAPSLSGSSPMFQASWVNDSSVLCCPPSVCCACLSFSGGAPARADVGNEVSEINSRTAETFSKQFRWLCFLTLLQQHHGDTPSSPSCESISSVFLAQCQGSNVPI